MHTYEIEKVNGMDNPVNTDTQNCVCKGCKQKVDKTYQNDLCRPCLNQIFKKLVGVIDSVRR